MFDINVHVEARVQGATYLLRMSVGFNTQMEDTQHTKADVNNTTQDYNTHKT